MTFWWWLIAIVAGAILLKIIVKTLKIVFVLLFIAVAGILLYCWQQGLLTRFFK